MSFFNNPARYTIMYSEHFQKRKRNRLKDKFWVAAFLNKDIRKHSCF